WGDGTQMLSWAADPSLMPQSIYHIYAAPGTYTVNVRVWDKDGDFGDTALQWLADMTPPQISHTITPVPGAAGWHHSPVTVAFTCTDDGVGVQTCPESQVVAAEGAGMAVAGTAVDRAGNRAVDTARVSIDLTPPVLKALAPAGWQRSDVTVGWACSDMLSGMDACTAPVTVTAEGRDQVVAGTAVDRAGNRAEATALVSIDRTAPVITAAAPAGWQRSDVTVAFTCSDALSGVAGCTAPVTVTAEGRDQAVAGTAVDRAGNRAEATALVSIDKTAPVITAAAPAGWQRTDVTVAFTCSDGLSDVAACPAPVTVSAEGRDQAVTGTAVDEAGNRAGATAQVSIDKTAPAIAFAGNTGLYEVDATIAIACAATDGLSGLATADCPGFSGPAWAYTPGDITLTARATDLAGNTGQATATFTILVTFDGLCRLTEQFGDSGGVNGALCSKLRTAKESAMSGDITTQNAALDRYVRDVQVHSGKNFTPFEADTLIRLASNLRR
ncbi:MAG TPA: hypothetical protein VNT75_33375, partial [Symbiobacteriaceae bacterium]|nr:hypothetical protein [Symbiobacteriaceae bacterium]